MNTFKFAVALATIVTASTAMAAEAQSQISRDQRMDEALQNYRSSASADRNPSPGRFARAEESVKRGAGKAGAAVKHGAKKAGHAVSTGAHKTGDALRRTGKKIEGASTSAAK